MPYFCTRIECGYFWDKRGRSRKKVQCPKCYSIKVLYIRHGKIEDIKGFIGRRRKWIKEQEEKASRLRFPEVLEPEPKPRERSRKTPEIVKLPEPEYQYCMWTNRGCINPGKKLSEDGFQCIKNKLKDDCLLLPDEEGEG